MKVQLIHRSQPYTNQYRNTAGDEGVRAQTKSENDRHVRELEREYEIKHPVIPGASIATTARRKAKQRELAKAWAIRNEPKRYLPFLLRKTNGIAADKELRRVNGVKAAPSSSWIKSIRTTAAGAPIIVETKSGKSYACPCPWQTAQEILTSKSVGAEVGKRLFTGTYKIGAQGTKSQGKIVNTVNGRIAKIKEL